MSVQMSQGIERDNALEFDDEIISKEEPKLSLGRETRKKSV